VTDVDTVLNTQNLTLGGTNANLFTIASVTRSGTSDSYTVVLNWQNPGNVGLGTYEVTLGGPAVTEANDIDLTFTVTGDAPSFGDLPANINVDETASVSTSVVDVNARAPVGGATDDTDITYAFVSNQAGEAFAPGAQALSDAQYLSIDQQTGEITVARTLPDQDVASPKSSLVVYVKASYAVPGSPRMKTAVQRVEVNISDVNDNNPVFTSGDPNDVQENSITANDNGSVKGRATVVYTAAATPDVTGETVAYSLSGTDANSFGIDSTSGEIWFRRPPDFEDKQSYIIDVVATVGAQSATKSLTISITDDPSDNFNLDGNSNGAGNTTRDVLVGDTDPNTVIIDADPSVQASADTITGFENQDSIRLGADDGSGTATVTLEYDGTNTLLYNTDTTGDSAAAKAGKVLAVLTGYDLSGAGQALQASDVIGATTVINVHGGGTGDNGRQTMFGAASTKDVFSVDTAESAVANADVIVNFEDGTDLIDLGTLGTVALKQAGNDVYAYDSSGNAAFDDGAGGFGLLFVLDGIDINDITADDFTNNSITVEIT